MFFVYSRMMELVSTFSEVVMLKTVKLKII